MPKRKQPEAEAAPETPSKRPRRQLSNREPSDLAEQSPLKPLSTPQKTRGTPSKNQTTPRSGHDRSGSETPKPNGKILFATPRKSATRNAETPSKKRADQSAKRKSATILAASRAADDWDGENGLAEAILEEEDEQAADATAVTTPKRGRGRPKGSRNKRSPTPEGDIAPEERYFFQNRTGPVHISDNVFSSVKLLTHDEYFEQAKVSESGHVAEQGYLMKLHRRSFPQWKLELDEGYSICLYGYGSKRLLTTRFAEWLHAHSNPNPAPQIVIVNGYAAKLTIRTILNTIASVVAAPAPAAASDDTLKLIGQPQEVLDSLLAYISRQRLRHQSLQRPVIVIVNSIDASSLSKNGVQDVLARLASHDLVQVVVTADTPFFPLLWNSSQLDLFNFAFHDCTTFSPYDAELAVVDEVYDLLGRKGRRMGGKDGIKYVLKSLPPNAQNLYRILLSEILSILLDDKTGRGNPGAGAGAGAGADDDDDDYADQAEEEEDDDDEERNGNNHPRKRARRGADEEVGIEYRLLYQKASEEFVASSDMNFRFLLKEFHDHQMITSRRDASGTELLCVPLGREEMQAVLEDLVVS